MRFRICLLLLMAVFCSLFASCGGPNALSGKITAADHILNESLTIDIKGRNVSYAGTYTFFTKPANLNSIYEYLVLNNDKSLFVELYQDKYILVRGKELSASPFIICEVDYMEPGKLKENDGQFAFFPAILQYSLDKKMYLPYHLFSENTPQMYANQPDASIRSVPFTVETGYTAAEIIRFYEDCGYTCEMIDQERIYVMSDDDVTNDFFVDILESGKMSWSFANRK